MDFPEYSDEGSLAREIFLRDDVFAIFYFEDKDHEVVYERLLERLIPAIKSFAVICVGGKTNLLNEWRNVQSHGPAYIFVLDKDYDDILGRLHDGSNLHYLRRYCFENYLLDVKGIVEIAVEMLSANPTRNLTRRDAMKAIDDYELFLSRLKENYGLATKFFLIARKFEVQNLPTTKMSIEELLSESEVDWPYPTKEWLIKYKRRLQDNCHGRNEWLADDDALRVQIDEAFSPISGQTISESDDDHMSGKHLLKCIRKYVENRLQVDFQEIEGVEFYLRLVGKINIQPLQYLAERVIHSNPQIIQENFVSRL